MFLSIFKIQFLTQLRNFHLFIVTISSEAMDTGWDNPELRKGLVCCCYYGNLLPPGGNVRARACACVCYSHIWLFATLWTVCVCVYVCLLQSHLTLCNPLDCSPPGSSVHGILTVKISYSHHAGFLFNYLFILQFESLVIYDIVLCCSVAKLDPTLCNLMDCSISGFPILHCLLEFAQVHVHWVSDAI